MIDFKEAFRIDFKKSIPLKERLQQKKIELASFKQVAEQDDNNGDDIEMTEVEAPIKVTTNTTTISAATTNPAATGDVENLNSNEGVETPMTTNLPARPSIMVDTNKNNNDNTNTTNTNTTTSRKSMATTTATTTTTVIKNDKEIKIAFILKLCTTQMACGQCTVDTEIHATNASLALGLYPPTLDIGPRVMHAAFESMSTYHYLATSRDIVLCKLQDVTSVAKIIALEGSTFMTNDIEALSAILDDIMNEPLPYGWLIQDIFFVSLGTLATIAAFFGSYSNMVIVFIISLFILMVQKLTRAYPAVLGPIELVLVSAVSSCLTAASYYISRHYDLGFDQQICNIPIIYLSPLLVYLPGSELIYGAYELQMGHMVVGGSRLVHALVKCMVMACGMLIGWQITGYNFVAEMDVEGQTIARGMEASFVPSGKCAPFSKPWNVGPWWMVFAVWNLLLLVPVLGGLQVRLSDMPTHYIIAYISLLCFGALNFQDSLNGLSSFLVNIIGLFFATNLSCFKEFITGAPAVSSIVPVLLVLAPGSVVVLQILTLMEIDANVPMSQQQKGQPDIASYLWLLGVTYSLGMYLALAIWKPILSKRELSADLLSTVRDKCKREYANIANHNH